MNLLPSHPATSSIGFDSHTSPRQCRGSLVAMPLHRLCRFAAPLKFRVFFIFSSNSGMAGASFSRFGVLFSHFRCLLHKNRPHASAGSAAILAAVSGILPETLRVHGLVFEIGILLPRRGFGKMPNLFPYSIWLC